MPRHTYTHATTGTPIPSVSDVLAQLKSSFRSRQIEEAAELGSAAHALVERSVQGHTVAPDDVPEAIAHIWQAFESWRFDRSPSAVVLRDGQIAAELSLTTPAVVPPELSYGGTLDLVVMVGNRRVLVDMKTRTSSESQLPTPDRHSLTQCGAYFGLWETCFTDLPLSGGLLLMLGRNAPVYREAWLTRGQLETRAREFAYLRAALAEHEAGKADVKATRRAERQARKGAA